MCKIFTYTPVGIPRRLVTVTNVCGISTRICASHVEFSQICASVQNFHTDMCQLCGIEK